MLIRALFGLFLLASAGAAQGSPLTRDECIARLKGMNDVREAKAWAAIKSDVKNELQFFRNRRDNFERATYLAEVSSHVLQKLEALAGTKNLGVHFNLHGGLRDEYAASGGIRAQIGDSGVGYGISRDFNKKVYFFRTTEFTLAQIFTIRNPNLIFFKVRLGTVFMLFNLDAPVLQEYRDLKLILKEAPSFMDFDEAGLRALKKYPGVPKEAFLVPPVEVFRRTKKILEERKLTWDEETLATLRFIERYVDIAVD